jgi:hypothetical protein
VKPYPTTEDKEGNMAAELIGSESVPEKYRGFFDNADWTLHGIVVQGSWVFLVAAVVIHVWVLTGLH